MLLLVSDAYSQASIKHRERRARSRHKNVQVEERRGVSQFLDVMYADDRRTLVCTSVWLRRTVLLLYLRMSCKEGRVEEIMRSFPQELELHRVIP